jgi:phage tail sheath protein FI
VYIEEVPSGVRTIAGVATSIAAFVGWAPRGPTEVAGHVLDWAEFEREYGGLHADSLLGYGVYHFFANGGTEAYVVRLVADDAVKATASVGTVDLVARSEGAWANEYGVDVKASAADPTRFRLSVRRHRPASAQEPNPPPDEVETFPNLSMDPADPRYVREVLEARSRVVKPVPLAPGGGGVENPPNDGEVMLTGGLDGAVLTPNEAAFEAALLDSKKDKAPLDKIDLFNLLCVPGQSNAAPLKELAAYCRDRRAFLIADCSQEEDLDSAVRLPTDLGGPGSTHSAVYFPWLYAPDPLQQMQKSDFPPCGFIAGLYARTDVARGVWKAPAGIEAGFANVLGPKVTMNDRQNGTLNPRAVNCIRTFPVYGTVCWGSRTLDGDDERGSEWKYVPIRRLALYIEESLYRGTKWVVFEPNDEPLWAQIRLNVGAFMNTLFRQGAFQGTSPRDAYFVKCDKSVNPQNDIDRGIVNILVGFAPLKPAEFVIIRIQQIPGDIQT